MSGEMLVLPNVYGLIRNSTGDVLIQRRWKPQSDPDTLGMWELPGGKWRAGESAQDCLRRELQEECGLEISSVDGSFAKHDHLDQQVETSTPLLMVQMLHGPYTSVLAIYSGFSDGQPAPAGDGARDAQFMSRADLKHALTADATEFTALSFAALTELAARNLL
jgi:8-oxo-dGTP diphosphatase